MKSEVLNYLYMANRLLRDDQLIFAETFVKLKMDFFRSYQNGMIFSTRFGADFFQEVRRRIIENEPIKAIVGEKLGEYDENFNRWLKNLS